MWCCWCATRPTASERQRVLRGLARRASSGSTCPTSTRSLIAPRGCWTATATSPLSSAMPESWAGRCFSPRRASSGRWPPTTWARCAGCRAVAAAAGERLARGAGVEYRGAAWAAVAADDSGAAAQPGALRRPAGLPEHKAGQPPVCAGAPPPLRQGRFAGQRRRRASGCQCDEPVRPPAGARRSRRRCYCQQGCDWVAASVGGDGCAVHTSGARPRHAEWRFVGPARFGQFRGRPELLDIYASAEDPATATRLWELTEQALGRPPPAERSPRHPCDLGVVDAALRTCGTKSRSSCKRPGRGPHDGRGVEVEARRLGATHGGCARAGPRAAVSGAAFDSGPRSACRGH